MKGIVLFALITLGGIVVIASAGILFAHAPIAGQDTSVNYGSIYPHARTTNIQMYGSIRNYSFMVTDYDNARGHLSNEVWGGTFSSPVYADIPPGGPEPDLWIVEAGSSDENVLNFYFGFPACSSSTAWGKIYWVTNYGSSGHWHSVKQKICIWPNRIGNGNRLGVNSQGLRYQYLTIQHEIAHALNLAHPTDSHGALMKDSASMLELNSYERDAIKNHY